MENQVVSLTWITPETITNMLIIGVIGVVLWLVLLGVYKSLMWMLMSTAKGVTRLLRGWAMRKNRKEIQKMRFLLEGAIVEAMEDAVTKGRISRETAQHWHMQFAGIGLLGFVQYRQRFCPAPPDQLELKNRLKKQRAERIAATKDKKVSVAKPEETQVDPLAAALYA